MQISNAFDDWGYPGNLELLKYKNIELFIKNTNQKKTTLFIGDSNIDQYYPKIQDLIYKNPDKASSVIFLTKHGCPSIPNIYSDLDDHKTCINPHLGLDLVDQNKNIKKVVIGGFWPNYLTNKANFYYKKNKEKFYINNDNENIGYKDALIELDSYIKKFKEKNIDITILLNTPYGKELSPKNMAKRNIKKFPNIYSLEIADPSRESIEHNLSKINKDLERIAKNNKIKAVNPLNFFCDNYNCASIENNEPLYKDESHIRPWAAKKYATFIDEFILY
jgi:hypothetical protein